MVRRLSLLLLIAAAACNRHGVSSAGSFKNAPVILISIDTLRADHLPAYGYRGVETPAIDALRADSILFQDAISHVPMTLPSHVSILTGLLPAQNGVRNNLGYPYDAARHPAIPMLLKPSGYATGAAVSAYVIRGATGLSSAFDSYDDAIPSHADVSVGELSRRGDSTVAVAEQWIGAHSNAPFFFFLHLFEPHTPYEPVEPFKSRFPSAYDGEIATADSYVGTFIAWLKQQGIYDRAIIVLLSDHGEGLGDHGEQEHGVLLYREAIHVPLMIKLPGEKSRGTTLAAPVQLSDVAPTILTALGVKVPAEMHGTSLLATLPSSRRLYSETFFPRIHLGWSELRSLTDERHQYIESPHPELFDTVADPGEKKNLYPEERRVYAQFRDAMQPYRDEAAQPSNVDPEEAAKLAALGYVGSVKSTAAAGPLPDPKEHIGELELMRQASHAETAGELDRALAAYESLVSTNPRFTDAWIKMAILHEHRGELQKAVESYQRAIVAAPELAPGLAISIASLQLRMGKPDDAAKHAELALQRSPGAAHILLARIALARHDAATAEREARAAMSDKTRSADAAVMLAQVLAVTGRLPEALDLVTQTAASTNGGAVENLDATRGDVLARMKRNDEAEAAFRSEIAHFPRNLDAYSKLAILFATENRLADLQNALQTMLKNNPGPAARRVAAGTYDALGLTREAAALRR